MFQVYGTREYDDGTVNEFSVPMPGASSEEEAREMFEEQFEGAEGEFTIEEVR